MKIETGLNIDRPESRPPWPHGLAEIMEFYGNPDMDGDLHADPVWDLANLVICDLPFPMRLSWGADEKGNYPVVTKVRAHHRCAWAMMAALRQFMDTVGEKRIRAEGWDFLGGVYNFRGQTGDRSYLSIHSWGAAIDINPHLGAYGVKPTQPPQLVEAFELYGALWGGRWPEMNPAWPYDGMHMQFCSGY